MNNNQMFALEPQNPLHNIGLAQYDATLMVFSPRNIPTQVIRPYQYRFDENLMGMLQNNLHALRETVGHTAMGASAALNSAILPTADGVVINTNSISTKWTFILVIDKPAPDGVNRLVATGFFTDEPIHTPSLQLTTPVLNEAAIMEFTSTSLLYVANSFSFNGPKQNLFVRDAGDITPVSTATFANNDLYFLSPGDIARFTKRACGGAVVGAYGELAVANQGKQYRATPVLQKSPRQHLREIINAVDIGVDVLTKDTTIHSPMESATRGFLSDPYNDFMNTVEQNLVSHDQSRLATLTLDTSRPMTLGQLNRLYPETKVLPHAMQTPQWDVRPQDLMIKQNVMSSLAYNTISSIALNCGIAEIAFRYNSWLNGPGVGAWELYHVNMIMPVPQQTIEESLNLFKRSIEFDLFPIIKQNVGDFDLMVRHDGTGQSLIDLSLLDWSTTNGGIYETCGALGGMTIPTIGRSENIDTNMNELHTLMNTIAANVGSSNGYGLPMM